jgi:hypothetical protein
MLISKINFKKYKKYCFNAFPREKHFEKQLLPQFQTLSNSTQWFDASFNDYIKS